MWTATAVPTRTGETEAASVAGRTADHQTRARLGTGAAATVIASGSFRKAGKVRLSLLDVGVASLLRLFAHVVEQGRVAGQLLDPGQPVVGGVHAGLDHAQRERAVLEHAPAPGHRLSLEVGQRHDLVDEAHSERLLGVVLLAQEPDLARLLLAHDSRQQPGTIASVEAAHLRSGLAEARVV